MTYIHVVHRNISFVVWKLSAFKLRSKVGLFARNKRKDCWLHYIFVHIISCTSLHNTYIKMKHSFHAFAMYKINETRYQVHNTLFHVFNVYSKLYKSQMHITSTCIHMYVMYIFTYYTYMICTTLEVYGFLYVQTQHNALNWLKKALWNFHLKVSSKKHYWHAFELISHENTLVRTSLVHIKKPWYYTLVLAPEKTKTVYTVAIVYTV